MDKCEWKDGKFTACFPLGCRLMQHGWKWSVFSDNIIDGINEYSFCPFCGADIRKSKEKQDPNDWSKEKWMAFYNAVKPFMETK